MTVTTNLLADIVYTSSHFSALSLHKRYFMLSAVFYLTVVTFAQTRRTLTSLLCCTSKFCRNEAHLTHSCKGDRELVITCSFRGERKHPIWFLYRIIWVKFGVFHYFTWDCLLFHQYCQQESKAEQLPRPCRAGHQDTVCTWAHRRPRNNKNSSTRIPKPGAFSRYTRGTFYTRGPERRNTGLGYNLTPAYEKI